MPWVAVGFVLVVVVPSSVVRSHSQSRLRLGSLALELVLLLLGRGVLLALVQVVLRVLVPLEVQEVLVQVLLPLALELRSWASS